MALWAKCQQQQLKALVAMVCRPPDQQDEVVLRDRLLPSHLLLGARRFAGRFVADCLLLGGLDHGPVLDREKVHHGRKGRSEARPPQNNRGASKNNAIMR